jgi:hypothetical protein
MSRVRRRRANESCARTSRPRPSVDAVMSALVAHRMTALAAPDRMSTGRHAIDSEQECRPRGDGGRATWPTPFQATRTVSAPMNVPYGRSRRAHASRAKVLRRSIEATFEPRQMFEDDGRNHDNRQPGGGRGSVSRSSTQPADVAGQPGPRSQLSSGESVADALTPLWDRFDALLLPLREAGWEVADDDDFAEIDPDEGPVLIRTLNRSCMEISATFIPDRCTLELGPSEPDMAPFPSEALFSMLDDNVIVQLSHDLDLDRTAIHDAAGGVDLLDPTVVAVTDDSSMSNAEMMSALYREWIFGPVIEEQDDADAAAVLESLVKDEDLELFLRLVARHRIAPDAVPSAATLGIAALCWRNETEVENWHHRVSNAVMAKTTISTTRVVRPYVSVDRIDWDSVERVLLDPGRALADGRRFADLFGEGWQPILDSVRDRLQVWRRLNDLLGDAPTVRLLSAAGATGYTRHWWGTGRWSMVCRTAVEDIAAAGHILPEPYDVRGPADLIADLIRAPDRLADEILAFCITRPTTGQAVPLGVGNSTVAPRTRAIEIHELWLPDTDESVDTVEDHDHAPIDAVQIEDFVAELILQGLEADPRWLDRCLEAGRSAELDADIRPEFDSLVANDRLLAEARELHRDSWLDADPRVRRALIVILVDRILVDPRPLPLHERVQVHWRSLYPVA